MTQLLAERRHRRGTSTTSAASCDVCRSNETKVLHRAGAGRQTALVPSCACNPHHVDAGPALRTVRGLETGMSIQQQRKRVAS